jgi:hypothetical protein
MPTIKLFLFGYDGQPVCQHQPVARLDFKFPFYYGINVETVILFRRLG